MHHLRLRRLLLPLAVFAACGEEQPATAPTGIGEPSFSHAGHKVVNSLADPGDGICDARQCTLREAIKAAGSTDITFVAGLTGTITLARTGAGGGQLVIEKALTITGPSSKITIKRRSTDPNFRIFRIGSGAVVRLTNLHISNGKTDGSGGGIVNNGTLALIQSTVTGNSAALQGGGISNYGPLTLTNSTVSNNTGNGINNHRRLTIVHSTIANNSGIGIYNHNNQTLTITRTTIGENAGRGLVNDSGTLILTNSSVSGNHGGGIAQVWGTSTISLSRVVDNSTRGDGGGISVGGAGSEMTIRTSTIARNSATTGGGVSNWEGSTMTILGSTILNNTARDDGGGIANEALAYGRVEAYLTLINSTVSGNSARFGGGIFNRHHLDEAGAGLTVINSTVVRNSAAQDGGGIYIYPGGFGMVNGLVALNDALTGPDIHQEFEGAVRYSLIGNGDGSVIGNTDGNQVGSSDSPIDPKIGPLTDNGGPTLTRALLANSPALDAASSADCPATDQRGVARPQGAGCDMGSYEKR